MLNFIWLGMIVLAVVLAGANDHLKEVNAAAFDSAKNAVMNLALPLVGTMALWLGLMRLAEKSGLVQLLARALRPFLRFLFPDVPATHPAMGSMVMNFSANMLGLANAATPLGLRAMKDLARLNPHPGTASNAMCTFLAINTSSIQLIPASTIALLASAGSKNPTSIVGTALISTFIAAVVGVSSAKLLQGLPVFRIPQTPAPDTTVPEAASEKNDTPASEATLSLAAPTLRPASIIAVLLIVGFFVFLLLTTSSGLPHDQASFVNFIQSVSVLAIPFLILFMTVFAATQGIRVYEEFVNGAKEGFETGIRIIPYLVAMLVAMGMFRASGGIDLITQAIGPTLERIHFPSELLPLALIRPLSGSGANGIFADLLKTYGPDHLLSRTAGTLIGSTETTFYVLAVYFGSVGIQRTRHAVLAGLLADLTGIVVSVWVCRWVFG